MKHGSLKKDFRRDWQAEWDKLALRVKNRKSADLEEFRTGLKELSSVYNSVWLKNVIKKCYGDLFDVLYCLQRDVVDTKSAFGEVVR